jgi:hypothetical protein
MWQSMTPALCFRHQTGKTFLQIFMLSLSLSLSLYQSLIHTLSPSLIYRGSYLGNTFLTVTIPRNWHLSKPSLLFGSLTHIDLKATPVYGVYQGMTPVGLIGQVTLGLFDAEYKDSPTFSLGDINIG